MQQGRIGVHSGLMRIRHLDMVPSVHPEAYLAPTAVLSGDVRVGRGSCIMHGAVLAAEGAPPAVPAAWSSAWPNSTGIPSPPVRAT